MFQLQIAQTGSSYCNAYRGIFEHFTVHK